MFSQQRQELYLNYQFQPCTGLVDVGLLTYQVLLSDWEIDMKFLMVAFMLSLLWVADAGKFTLN